MALDISTSFPSNSKRLQRYLDSVGVPLEWMNHISIKNAFALTIHPIYIFRSTDENMRYQFQHENFENLAFDCVQLEFSI